MLQIIQNVISSIGYLGIGLLVFAENVIPPIPSEVVIPFSGFSARNTHLTLWGVVLAGTIGSTVGAIPLYYLGRLLGEDRVLRFVDKYGKWLLVDRDEVERANRWLRERGKMAVFVCRMIPGIRSLISIPAGISRMNMLVFIFWTAFGTFLWTLLLGVLGYALGSEYHVIASVIDRFGWVIFGLIVVFFVYRLWQKSRESSE